MAVKYSFIVSDIGASNVRFGLFDADADLGHQISYIQKYPRHGFKAFHDALNKFQRSFAGELDISVLPIALAIAGARLNAETWQFSEQQWHFEKDERIITQISDLQGFALGAIADQNHIVIRETRPKKDLEFKDTVIAIGTGLGLAYHQNGQSFRTHGGHMHAFGVSEEQNTIIRILRRLSSQERMVIHEDLVSGNGLVKLYQAVCIYNGYPVLLTSPEDIVEKAKPIILEQTLRLFHEFLGLFAHMALVFGHGYKGLYLGGGVMDVLNNRGLFDTETFITFLNLNAQEIVANNIENCPIHLISDPNIALLGAAQAALKERG